MSLGAISYVCPFDIEITGIQFAWMGEFHPMSRDNSGNKQDYLMRIQWYKAAASGGAGSNETDWAYVWQDNVSVGDKIGGEPNTYSPGEVYTYDISSLNGRTFSKGEKMAFVFSHYAYSGQYIAYKHDFDSTDSYITFGDANVAAYGRMIVTGRKI